MPVPMHREMAPMLLLLLGYASIVASTMCQAILFATIVEHLQKLQEYASIVITIILQHLSSATSVAHLPIPGLLHTSMISPIGLVILQNWEDDRPHPPPNRPFSPPAFPHPLPQMLPTLLWMIPIFSTALICGTIWRTMTCTG